jgi:hypothetical protein
LAVGAAGRTFTSYTAVKPVLDSLHAQLPPELRDPTPAKWAAWTQSQDKAIRARLEQGDLDSMVNLLLFGTSFTTQPRIRVENIGEASKSGVLRARVDDLVAGLRAPRDNERLSFLAGLLRRKGKDPASSEAGVFLYSNLQRVLKERTALAERARQSTGQTVLDRSSLFSDRGVSLDTSILPDFAIEQTLRDLKTRAILHDGQVLRAAVIGPGLDFIDKREESGYDYYPQQTVQPFALYDSLLRLALAKSPGLSLGVFDISARVIDHMQRARRSPGYVIQLPRDVGRPWPQELIAYWRSLGDHIGTKVAPIQPPAIFKDLETRAVRIRPDVVQALEPLDLNIVLERESLPAARRYDLMVATNIFVYYDAFQQSLALENIGAMLKPGGLLLTNDKLPEISGGSMRLAGTTVVRAGDAGVLDAVGWYQKN